MKCIVEFTGNKAKYETTKDHYKAMIQFLKHVFANTEFYEQLYTTKHFKPFVTAMRFNGMKPLEGYAHIEVKMPMRIMFSTDNDAIFKAFIESLYNTAYTYEIDDVDELRISSIDCHTSSKVNVRKVRVKTLSPVVVKRPHVGFKNQRHGYIYMVEGQEGYMKALNEYTKKRQLFLTGKEANNISIESINTRATNIPFYGGFVRGTIGNFYLHGEPDTLEFVLNNGLGVKTGAGFGYITYA